MRENEFFLTVRIDEPTRKQLKKRAKENDRTMGAEIRIAIRAHLAETKGAASA